MKPPIVGICQNPLVGVRPQDMRYAIAGQTIAELAPDTDRPFVCTINGGEDYLPRRQWGARVVPGDIVLFVIDPPQDKDTLRGLLQLALAIASTFLPPPFNFLALLAGNALINELLPPTLPTVNTPEAASPTYSTSLTGNQARLFQPIPKICGRHQIFPAFAAEPYHEFDSNDDQYYYAVLAVGIGEHEIERALIDDTDINHFADIIVNEYLPPGQLPSMALANVSSAPEVSSQELVPGQYVGGFSACEPRRRCAFVGFDIVLNGLGVQDGGGINNDSVTVRFEYRSIDDFGAATTPWTVLGTETITDATTSQVRRSFKYEIYPAARVECRAVRTDPKVESLGTLNTVVWAGLRGYQDQAATLNPNAAHYEIVMRASEQLNGMSQRRISLIVQAKTRTWAPGSPTGWGAVEHTRNPAFWLLDLLTSSVWGEGFSDDRIDLMSFYELSLIWAERQDRFDYVFDTSMSSWEAMQLIARSGRARVFRRNGLITIARDEYADLPVTAFTPRMVPEGSSMTVTERTPTRDTPDGVIVEYFDNRSWSWTPIECPCPGVVSMTNPVRLRLPGITGAKHAEREGLYEAAVILYRTRRVRNKIELEGILPAYMSPVRWQPDIYGYGQSGDVTYWDAASKTMGLSEAPEWDGETQYIVLMRDDGSLTTPAVVTPGGTPYHVVLPTVPDFTIVVDDPARERTKYFIGSEDRDAEMIRVTAISDGGKSQDGAQFYIIDGVVDDERVHTVDNHLLPGPGDIQDPVGTSGDIDEGGGSLVLVSITDRSVVASTVQGDAAHARIIFQNDGYLRVQREDNAGDTDVLVSSEWLVFQPVETSTADDYEVRVTVTSGALTGGSSATGAWLSLGTNRTYQCVTVGDNNEEQTATLFIEIREVATELVQDSATITLSAGTFIIGGG